MAFAGASAGEGQAASVDWATSSAAWATAIILVFFAIVSCYTLARMRFKLARTVAASLSIPKCLAAFITLSLNRRAS